ncbi:hypothetical protein F4560_003058 [Saccharothrix ecbatanensis]|uniref:Uncharacterized protein n=1 Tax=Saccharothrix ecbatanensis TaxID=1105145 RepID=A0A7W9M0U5_9PSEU|nr:hypothetical protein [Saccharothrix ecbatanensis]MBB5803290.1 hypothetical protein [Saccharothrix ecbatanensis]
MLLVPDEGAVEEFVAAAADPAFRDRIHPWDADAAEDDLDARVGEDGIEQRRELPVPVADQEPHVSALVFEVHDEVPGGLGDPGCGRVRGGSEDTVPGAGVLDHREDVINRGRVTIRIDLRQEVPGLSPQQFWLVGTRELDHLALVAPALNDQVLTAIPASTWWPIQDQGRCTRGCIRGI